MSHISTNYLDNSYSDSSSIPLFNSTSSNSLHSLSTNSLVNDNTLFTNISNSVPYSSLSASLPSFGTLFDLSGLTNLLTMFIPSTAVKDLYYLIL
jgi:hypothetical protein